MASQTSEPIPILKAIQNGEQPIAVTFSGLDVHALEDLRYLTARGDRYKELFDLICHRITELLQMPEARDSGLFRHGLDLPTWVEDGSLVPGDAYMLQTHVGLPAVYAAQVLWITFLVEELGLSTERARVSTTGHSQGMLAAILLAESLPSGKVNDRRVKELLEVVFWQGVFLQEDANEVFSPPDDEIPDVTPCLQVRGLVQRDVEALLHAFARAEPRCGDQLYLNLGNSPHRQVVAGPVPMLRRFATFLERARKGAIEDLKVPGHCSWSFMHLLGPYHTPYLGSSLEKTMEMCRRSGLVFNGQRLRIPVVECSEGQRLDGQADITRRVLEVQLVAPLRWPRALRSCVEANGAQLVLDMGPGEGFGRLVRECLEGSGIRVLSMPSQGDRAMLSKPEGAMPRAVVWGDFTPRSDERDGKKYLSSRFTEETGFLPFILPGMTPTTGDVEIVANAANAGFMAELAGGAQPTEEVFWKRMDELAQALEPGRQVVFNALYLDPYLWNLHVAKRGLVLQARRRGYPICGVTISAGIPDVEEAVEILAKLREAGLWLNGLKPGTSDQVMKALRVADALPDHHTLFLYVEGGKAGGHHSDEDLEEILLWTYHEIRRRPNVVLCAGGGIGTEDYARQLLSGEWSHRYGEQLMPVDAVFIGTLAMITRESKASPQVKRALFDALGTDKILGHGESGGGVVSARSGLGAPIYYLDNNAARAALLLEEVKTKEGQAETRRAEVVSALEKTARPYFGDLTEMSVKQVLERMLDLMAVGHGGPYEDGPWPDVTYRQRFADFLWRLEARLNAHRQEAFDSVLGSLEELDQPREVLARFLRAYPWAETERLHPADIDYFMNRICRRPGKPVNFVPALGPEAHRWYSSDALWHAHSPRYAAEGVLVTPGPKALMGHKRLDEPVAELFGRFHEYALRRLPDSAEGISPAAALPRGIVVEKHEAGCEEVEIVDKTPWQSLVRYVQDQYPGLLADFLASRDVQDGQLFYPNPAVQALTEIGEGRIRLVSNGELTSLEYVHPSGDVMRVERVSDDQVRVVFLPAFCGERKSEIPFSFAAARTNGLCARPCFIREENTQGEGSFYHKLFFGEDLDPGPLFEEASFQVDVPERLFTPYNVATGAEPHKGLQLPALFGLAWRPIFSVLGCEEFREHLPWLLHLDADVRLLNEQGTRIRPGDQVRSFARVTEVGEGAGTSVKVAGGIEHHGHVCAIFVTTFYFTRQGLVPWKHKAVRRVTTKLQVQDEALAQVLREAHFLQWKPGFVPTVGQELSVDCVVEAVESKANGPECTAQGHILFEGEQVAEILGMKEKGLDHPVERLVGELAGETDPVKKPRKVTLVAHSRAPARMDAFAAASGDWNPIHLSPLFARAFGHPKTIVHGLWLAARLCSLAQDRKAGGARPRRVHARFLNKVDTGEKLSFECARVGARDGGVVLSCLALVEQGQKYAEVTVELDAPPTAYAFPGQGIQRPGMGMDAYARSKAARDAWDTADTVTREKLGFSLLHVVRENPGWIRTRYGTFQHPDGVLYLTQFTQVAMAALASAQVAEMREQGVLAKNAYACGHSVGEYNALGAYLNLLPMEAVIEIVFRRGLVMHGLVERDHKGRSRYRMGVIRPHHAGLSEEEAQALVRQVQEFTGEFLEVVNFNIRGMQYSVTGTAKALELLKQRLESTATKGAKPPYVEVPGIDVPFHSRLLRGGVPEFRRHLDSILPESVDPDALVGRYIPNLTARPFSLDEDYLREVHSITKSEQLGSLLRGSKGTLSEAKIARALLLELLAHQFANPVRWIETQEFLFREARVRRFVELGVGYQPTLANMAKATRRYLGIEEEELQIYNSEADRPLVFLTDESVSPKQSSSPSPEVEAPSQEDAIRVHGQPESALAKAQNEVSVPFGPLAGLKTLLAVQAKSTAEEIQDTATIDDVFRGVSARRNQALADLAQEFGAPQVQGASDKPVAELATEIESLAPGYDSPGPYLSAVVQQGVHNALGHLGLDQTGLLDEVKKRYAVDSGTANHVVATLAVWHRSGAYEDEIGERPKDRADLGVWLDRLVKVTARRLGVDIPRRVSPKASAVVDSSALKELEDRVLGPEGVLADSAMHLLQSLGIEVGKKVSDTKVSSDSELESVREELGEEFLKATRGIFDGQKHVVLRGGQVFARRDLAQACTSVLWGQSKVEDVHEILRRVTGWASCSTVRSTASYFAGKARAAGNDSLLAMLEPIAQGEEKRYPVPTVPTRPKVVETEDALEVVEEPTGKLHDFIANLLEVHESPRLLGLDRSPRPEQTLKLHSAWKAGLESAFDFSSTVALVTGASPHSIASAVLGHLLRGGAKVVVTTSTYGGERLDFYRSLYQRCASNGAELHVLPMNQASLLDVQSLLVWLSERPELMPDLVLPFGAIADLGSLAELTPRAEAVLRAMVLGVERLIAGLARWKLAAGDLVRPLHAVLPLSPNLGSFGGDSTYAESKASLAVTMRKWSSEWHAWGRATTLCGALIGWVRGTGLMKANDLAAAWLESRGRMRTFSAAEMGYLIAGLCADEVRTQCLDQPLVCDLTHGLAEANDLRAAVQEAMADIERERVRLRRLKRLRKAVEGETREGRVRIEPVSGWPREVADLSRAADLVDSWPAPQARAQEMVVVCGMGELGPFGSARIRHLVETCGLPDRAGMIELLWVTGRVKYDEKEGSFVYLPSGQKVREFSVVSDHIDILHNETGIRPVSRESAGFDPHDWTIWTEKFLEGSVTLRVASVHEAFQMKARDPDHVRVLESPDGHPRVMLLRGAAIRVPKQGHLPRDVAGLLPTGFDFGRLGVPREMEANVDRVSLMNLVATADAFASAGLEPEEVVEGIHPALVGNTQGSGIGGMRSLHRLYLDFTLDHERQPDVVQESLANVPGAYVMQSLVGGYGCMVHPVGACATVAVSLEEAFDKVRLGKAALAIAGGYDDIGAEGIVGFADMQATADTQAMRERGLPADRMCRPNDARRAGFLEGQGGGTILVCRGDLALRLGLPVYGVLGYAGTFADGIHTSIPAPGPGIVAAARGGRDSPLMKALASLGLSADDIKVVYKHDTSTRANDPNEHLLHERIQEALGRSEGNPLFVVSQKWITGHAKGGAAAFQVIGCLQAMLDDVVPGNRNLESPDVHTWDGRYLTYTDSTVRVPRGFLKAALVSSLGFGHVGGLLLLVHPATFLRALEPHERTAYLSKVTERLHHQERHWAKVLCHKKPHFTPRTKGRYRGDEEIAMLLGRRPVEEGK